MTFFEIAGGTEGRVLIPLTAVARIEGRPDGQGGATIWLLDGKSYPVTEPPDEVRIAIQTSEVGRPNRLTFEAPPEKRPMLAVGW